MATLRTSDPWWLIERGQQVDTYMTIGQLVEGVIYKIIARSGEDARTTAALLHESVDEALRDFLEEPSEVGE